MGLGKYAGFEITLEEPGIAILTPDQPERRNGMSVALKRDLIEALQQAQMDDTVRVVRELADGPQVAMRLLKRSLYYAAEFGWSHACADIAARTAVSDRRPDAREGVRAWREKRAPKFNQGPGDPPA